MRTMNKVVILLVSLGLILGSATVRAATPLPLRQVENAATVSEQIATAKSAPPTLAEHFRRDEGRWDLASSEAVERLFATSTLRLNIIAQQTVGWSISEFSATDFYLEVDAFHVTGPLDNEFGVVFRYQDDENFYLFATSSDGYYTVQKMEAGEWSELIEWADAEAINQGEAAGNTLGVLADGSRITVSINGELVGAVEDESFASGQIGLLAGSFDDGGVEIAFDDLLLWDLAGEPAPEPTPSPTEEVTSTEEATPTAVPSDLAETLDAIRATEPLLSDDFRTDTGAWPTTTDDDVTYSYARRTYQLEIHTANWLGFAFNTAIEERPIPNLLAEVDITQAAGPAAAEYGLLFHYQDSDNFYMAAISGQGTYGVWKKIDAEWATLIDWTESDLLDTEAETTHRLSLLVQGDQITLLVNDAVLAEVQDEATIVGTIGLVAGAFDEPGVVAAFDNFEVWQLEGETPTLDQTPELGPTPEPENTPEPVDVSARLAEIQATDPTFTEDFRRDEGVWSTTADDQSEFFYERRTYHILVNVTGWMSWQFPEPALEPPPADFLAEVDVEHVAGPTNGEYGLIFRYVDQQNFYFYAISGLGTYSLWKKVDDEWQTLIDWTESPALVAGEGAINRIGVLAEGATITLLANETSVAQFEDESFAAGAVGLAAGTFDEAGLEVAFDNLDLWVITTGTAQQTEPVIEVPADEIAQRLDEIRAVEATFSDDFRSDSGLWANPDYDDVTFAYARGAYYITVEGTNITPASTGDVTVTDFLLEVEAAQTSGPAGQYGLFFRQVDDDNFYLFTVSPAQSYTLWEMVDGEWNELIPWTDAEAILGGEGEVNRLGVLAEGALITLLVNDTPLAQYTDDTFASGNIALAAGTFDEGGVEVEFDNVEVWLIE